MKYLTPLWQFLESRPSAIAVQSEWRAQLGDCYEIVAPLLKPTDQNATRYPSTHPELPPRRIVQHGDGRIVAVCDDDRTRNIELNVQDILLYQLCPRQLRTSLSRSLALRTATTPVQSCRKMQVGMWEPQPSVAFPVQLLVHSDPQSLLHDIVARRQPNGLGLILLTPTRENWTDDAIRCASDQKSLLVSADETIVANGQGFSAGNAWWDHLGAFCKLVGRQFPARFANKRPKRKRAQRTAAIEALKTAMVDEIVARKRMLQAAEDVGGDMVLPPPPTKQDLGKRAGIPPYTVTRCFGDSRELQALYRMLDSIEHVLRFG